MENVLKVQPVTQAPGGVEIYFEDKDAAADKIWNAIFAEGTPKGLKPIGLAARDTLRLKWDIAYMVMTWMTLTTPLEAGWAG